VQINGPVTIRQTNLLAAPEKRQPPAAAPIRAKAHEEYSPSQKNVVPIKQHHRFDSGRAIPIPSDQKHAKAMAAYISTEQYTVDPLNELVERIDIYI